MSFPEIALLLFAIVITDDDLCLVELLELIANICLFLWQNFPVSIPLYLIIQEVMLFICSKNFIEPEIDAMLSCALKWKMKVNMMMGVRGGKAENL